MAYYQPYSVDVGPPVAFQNGYDNGYNQQQQHLRPFYYGSLGHAGAYKVAPPPPVEPSPGYGYPYWQQQGYHQGASVMHAPQPAPNPVAIQSDEKNGGGVSSYLDYEFSDMADFLSSMAHGIMVPTSAKWDNNNLLSLQRFLVQVLTATRLPRPTIVLALVYMSKRWAIIAEADPSSDMVYKMIVVSLVLANKFHDDNTFTNSSWFKATNIPVAEITSFEAQWLRDIKWSLHLNPSDTQAWFKWNDCWQIFIKARSAPTPASPVSLTDTKVPLSPAEMLRQHGSPALTPTSANSPAFEPISPPSVQRPYTIPRWFETARSKSTQAPFVSHFVGTNISGAPLQSAALSQQQQQQQQQAPPPPPPPAYNAMLLQPPYIYGAPPHPQQQPINQGMFMMSVCDPNYQNYAGYGWNYPLMEKKTDWFSVAAC